MPIDGLVVYSSFLTMNDKAIDRDDQLLYFVANLLKGKTL